MDTFIKIIQKDKIIGLAASHFGSDDNMMRATYVLLKICTHTILTYDEYDFINHNLHSYKLNDEQEIEVVIDTVNQEVDYQTGFDIRKIQEDDNSVRHVSFERADLLLNSEMSFKDFAILYDFYQTLTNYSQVIINNKYLLKIKHSVN